MVGIGQKARKEPPGGAQKPPQVLIFGDSHTIAIQKALLRREMLGLPLEISAFRQLKRKGEELIGDLSFESFLERVALLGPEDVVISTIGGSHYAIVSTVQHAQPFDFHTEEEAVRSTDAAEIIPFRAIRDFLAQTIIEGFKSDDVHIRGDGPMLEAVRRATKARVVHIVPPPPIRDSDELSSRHEQSFAKLGIASRGVSNAELRLKFWLTQAAILKRFCEERDIELWMPPTDSVEGGFLRPEQHKGGAHANWLYGDLVLRQIEERFFDPA